ncbi:MAG: YHS domain-containing protein [Candidatus Zixiibacteriota bacterium]
MLHKTLLLLLAFALLVSAPLVSGFAGGGQCQSGHAGDVQVIEKAVDPVCGMSLKPEGIKQMAVHDGHLYAFCNKKCLETFKENPEKYAGKLVKDPVCGMTFFDHQTDLASEHAGHKSHFCSQDCVKKFKANPDKYEKPGK